MESSCCLAALGMVNALGSGIDEIWRRLLDGDQSRFRVREDLVPDRRLLLGEVSGALPALPERLARFASRNNALCLAALEQIADPLASILERVGAERVGVVMGTSTSGVSDAENAIRHEQETGRLAPEFYYEQLEFGGIADFVSRWLGARGPAYTLSTACSSGARALASARSLLNLGLCDAVVAGATDSLCGLTTGGFSALQALSGSITNPCSRNRSGLTLGEGAAAFLVTRETGGVRLVGVGDGCRVAAGRHIIRAGDQRRDVRRRNRRKGVRRSELFCLAVLCDRIGHFGRRARLSWINVGKARNKRSDRGGDHGRRYYCPDGPPRTRSRPRC